MGRKAGAHLHTPDGTLIPIVGGQPPACALMILPQVHLRKPCYDFYFL